MSLTDSQQARMNRILEVAARLASEGGFDAAQMRSVAAEAEVALGTLYRYFPSKEYLLVAVMLQQIGELSTGLQARPPVGTTPVERVTNVLHRANQALQRQPQFTAALMRALLSGDQSIAPVVAEVREAMASIILSAMSDSPDQRMRLVARVLDEVWFASLVAWISGVEPAAAIDHNLQTAASLLLEGET